MEREASSSCSCRARTLVSTFATILLLFQQTCAAKHHQPCLPTSCGKIPSITYPFRLKGDPSHCGDRRYELDCENNATVLTLFSGKYHVQDIDYKRYKIRFSDAGVVEDTTCSFVPRYFLYDRSFSNAVGPDDFGTEPFTLDPFDPPRIAFFNCTNPVTDDPRYVKVDTSRCVSRGHVYAVMEPSLFQYRVMDIKVGCSLKVATLASRRLSETENGNVSYDDIHMVMVEGFEVSWLSVICEDRCGTRTNCQVIDESTGEVQFDNRYCHYANHTTDKCGISQQIIGYTRGIYSRITFSTKQLDDPVGLQYFDGGIFIGRYILPSFVAARSH